MARSDCNSAAGSSPVRSLTKDARAASAAESLHVHEKASAPISMQLDGSPAQRRACQCNVRAAGCGLACVALTATSAICLLTAHRSGALCRGFALCSWTPALRGGVVRSNSSPAQHPSAPGAALSQALAAHAAADMWCTGHDMPEYARACLVKDLYYDREARRFQFFGSTIMMNESDTAQAATAELFNQQTCAPFADVHAEVVCAPGRYAKCTIDVWLCHFVF